MKLLKTYTIEDLKPIPKRYIKLFREMWKEISLLSFSWDLEKAFDIIRKNDYELTSIFLAVETLKSELYGRKKYMKITREKVPSILKQKMIELSFGDRNFNLLVEKVCKGLKGEEFDKCVDELLEKTYRKNALEILKGEYQELYPRSWKKKLKDIYRERWKFFYERRCEMQPLFSHFDWRNDWVQVFIIKHENGIHWDVGGSASSGKRATHEFYGTLFCRVQRKIKDIPLIILWYDSENNFRYVATLKEFAICPKEMWGKEEETNNVKKILFKEDYLYYKNSKIEIYM